MDSPFTLKEIAHQAGLSLATVDRVLHGRDHVRAVTRDRVLAAIAELERQHAASRLEGRRLTLDIVMHTPERFSHAVRAAFEAELPLMRPATFRARFHLAEILSEAEQIARLRAIARRGTQGIVLKAKATARIEACLADLKAQGIPVVTYVTDVATPLRLAYVGIENQRAGATVGYLMARMLPETPTRVLVTLSSAEFEGEEARRAGFAAYLAEKARHLAVTTVSEGHGVDRTTEALIRQALEAHPDIACVYSIGGGNEAILSAFAAAGRRIAVFAAHDLDRTNRALLQACKVSFVIHHDFRQDARRVALHFARHYRLIDPETRIEPSEISIACPV
jgi:LacI family transcriptional regulator